MVLWRPSQNNQRYAFTPLLDGDEDYSSDEEVLYNDAWDGMKMRGKGASRPDSPPSGTGREMEVLPSGILSLSYHNAGRHGCKVLGIFYGHCHYKKNCTVLLCTNGSVHCAVSINKSDPCRQNKGRMNLHYREYGTVPPPLPLLNVMYCVRVKIFLAPK